MMYLWLVVGFVLLVKGADLFVDGSSSLAKILKVPSVVIGLTIVAMGTSAPEAAVSITAGIDGNNGLAVGNILGSNMFNLILIVGICAAIKAFTVDKGILKRDFIVTILAAMLLLAFMLDHKISQLEGLVFVICMVAYIMITVIDALKSRKQMEDEIPNMAPSKSIIYLIIGIAAVIFGGNLVVNNASLIAQQLGLSQTLIGLTIVSIGTSLPELVTSVMASRKGDSGLALGNVVGSNIFNILFILGMSSSLHEIKVANESLIDVAILIICSLILFIYCKIKKKVSRVAGIACILTYIVFTVYIIMR